ncbi:MAG: Ig-like domain-containing protein, partial [Gemmatimonadaceae bacterium]
MTVLLALAACASVATPPGGPVDLDPPEVISASIDTNATGVTAGKLELRFNEVIAERPSGAAGVTLEAIVLVSPRTGSAKVQWNRRSITIEPRGGFRPNTTYRVTLLPGLADIRGNISNLPRYYVFSTGPTIAPFSILGRVFDWQAAASAPGAVVEAVANVGRADSAVYLAVADSLGQFELGPLDAGRYLVRTFIDGDRNRDRGVLEKWDTVMVNVTDHRPSVELLAAQRDTAAADIASVEALDSVWVRVRLDKPFDPRIRIQPTQVVVQRSDSS